MKKPQKTLKRNYYFFAQYISKYPAAIKTKWYGDLLHYIEKYRTETGTYLFPAKWLKELTGYAVQGHHMSFGENRRKKNWREIESTFYVQLLQQSLCHSYHRRHLHKRKYANA